MVGITVPPSHGPMAAPNPMRPRYTNVPGAFVDNFSARAPNSRSFAGARIHETFTTQNVDRLRRGRDAERHSHAGVQTHLECNLALTVGLGRMDSARWADVHKLRLADQHTGVTPPEAKESMPHSLLRHRPI